MKKLLVVFLVFSLVLSGCSNGILKDKNDTAESTDVTSENDVILVNDYADKVEELALNIQSYQNSKVGFRIAGTEEDIIVGNIIYDKMKEIGLSNVTKDDITLDSWDFGGISLTFPCTCNDTGILKFDLIGSYPSNISYTEKEIDIVNVSEISSIDSKMSGKAIYYKMTEEDKLTDLYLKAKENGVDFIVISYYSEDGVTLKTKLEDNLVLDIGLAILNEYNGKVLSDAIKDGNGSIPLSISINSKIIKDVNTFNVYGEIPGVDTNNIIYVTANRDAFYNGYFGNAIGVAEVLTLAEKMIAEGIRPEKTIRFLITTGKEFGKEGKLGNQGLIAQLEKRPEWIDSAFLVLNFDGSKPYLNNLEYTNLAVPALLDYLDTINESISIKDSVYSIKSKEITKERLREDREWLGAGVPVISLGESDGLASEYLKLYNTSNDTVLNGIDKSQIEFILNYYTDFILKFSVIPYIPMDFKKMLTEEDAAYYKVVNLEEKELNVYNAGNSEIYKAFQRMQKEVMVDAIIKCRSKK